VQFNEDTNTYHLVQRKYTVEDITTHYTRPEVVRFQMGVSSKKDKKDKKDKKEVKEKLTLDFGEEEEEPEFVLKEDENENENEDKDKETLEKESIKKIEETPEYKLIWYGLNPKYKDFLVKDPKWLEETMAAYMKARKEKKMREFYNPSDLVLPPIIDDVSGKFDFGNETYNEIMNGLPREQKQNMKNLFTSSETREFMDNELKKILRAEFRLAKF
jgi:hypothetical protein